MYAYCNGNPVMLVDPTGIAPVYSRFFPPSIWDFFARPIDSWALGMDEKPMLLKYLEIFMIDLFGVLDFELAKIKTSFDNTFKVLTGTVTFEKFRQDIYGIKGFTFMLGRFSNIIEKWVSDFNKFMTETIAGFNLADIIIGTGLGFIPKIGPFLAGGYELFGGLMSIKEMLRLDALGETIGRISKFIGDTNPGMWIVFIITGIKR